MAESSSSIVIESFAQPSHSWQAKNDPVMGGRSKATVSIENGLALFDGDVVDVPFLQAPGFITMETRDSKAYPDVSSCHSLRLYARASEPYDGYRFSFGTAHVPGNRFAFGYKANFSPPVGSEMGNIDIPFRDFTVRWDDATGDPVVTCEEDESFCPDVKTLQDMGSMSIWGEGVAGKVHLDIQSISAIGCSPESALAASNGGAYTGQRGVSPMVSSRVLRAYVLFGFFLVLIATVVAMKVIRRRRRSKDVLESSEIFDSNLVLDLGHQIS